MSHTIFVAHDVPYHAGVTGERHLHLAPGTGVALTRIGVMDDATFNESNTCRLPKVAATATARDVPGETALEEHRMIPTLVFSVTGDQPAPDQDTAEAWVGDAVRQTGAREVSRYRTDEDNRLAAALLSLAEGFEGARFRTIDSLRSDPADNLHGIDPDRLVDTAIARGVIEDRGAVGYGLTAAFADGCNVRRCALVRGVELHFHKTGADDVDYLAGALMVDFDYVDYGYAQDQVELVVYG